MVEVQVLSLPFMLWSLSGGASVPKADNPKGYVGSNPIHSVCVRVAHLEERPSPKGKAVGSNPITNIMSP